MGKQAEKAFFCTGADEVIKQINENNPEYTHAYLDTYPLSESQAQALAKAIENNNHLTYLNIFDCHLNNHQLHILLNALQNNHSIIEITINKDIGADLYEQFMQAIAVPGDYDSTFLK